jgi:hypothetical protein
LLEQGKVANPATIANLREDIADSLRQTIIDRAETAVLEGDKKSKGFILQGTQAGTTVGEVWRFMAQFKSFSVLYGQRVLSREIYGRGYDTFGDYLKNGKGDMLGLAQLMLWMTLFGYGALTAKDALKGKEPRDPLSKKTWAEAFIQGGGAGIYGDFIANEQTRYGNSLVASVAGVTASGVEDIFNIKTAIQQGDDPRAKMVKFAVSNTPFANLFYTKPVLDYLITHRVQEALDPGFLRRQERRVEKEGQEYFLKPSELQR